MNFYSTKRESILSKNIITKEAIENTWDRSKNEVFLLRDSIVTPLAMDYIKERKIKIIYKDSSGIGPMDAYDPTIDGPQYPIEDFSSDLILSFYYYMLKIRFFEELVRVYREKEIIPGIFVHSYIGQEAIAVGMCSTLEKKDFITSTHRGHGHLIAKGADMKYMLAEMLGKSDGYCRGKGGSMHITDIGIGILGANGIVGAGLPIACGSAMASKLNGDDVVTVSFFGDGSTNQGTFGESLNFAKVFSLPVIFLCENNSYAVSTTQASSCSSSHIYQRAAGYEIISEAINGDDVFEVYSTCKKYVEKLRQNHFPVFIEARTHRQLGHWVGDPQKYRSEEEMRALLDFDPLKIFLRRVKDTAAVPDSSLKEVESRVQNEIKEAAAFASRSSYPSADEAIKDYLKE
jgi:acetoin:2,6-dichlorophenolindophenol oxidoreductase subunit alpha